MQPTTTPDFSMEGEARFGFSDEERYLEIVITPEGVIMDAYLIDPDGNEVLAGTVGMMADELFDFIERNDPLGRE